MTDVETKRGRVRRLLITPLEDRGFRFKAGTPADKQRRYLDELADALGYMHDVRLAMLEECLRSKGEGAARCFWPAYATVIGFAEACQPRPIEEMPQMASWLGSVEGPKARREGTLVATFLFVETFKRPPFGDADRRKVAARAAELNDDLARVRDRIDRGFGSEDDRRRAAWFAGIEARAQALVAAGEAKRGEAA